MKRPLSYVPCLLPLLLLTSAAALAKPRPGRGIPPEQREPIIREVYGKLAELVRAGGEEISFELDNLQTIEANDFDTLSWLDALTPPGGWRIATRREVRQWDGVIDLVVYRSQWREAPDHLAATSGLALAGLTVEDVLREVAKEQPSVTTATALSWYDVVVSYQGRSRAYKAAALWLPARAGRDATVFFQDHVTAGLEKAASERPLPPRPQVPSTLTEKARRGTCIAHDYEMLSYLAADRSSDDHFYGGDHYSRHQVKFRCHYADSCSATCTPEFTVNECDDYNWDNMVFWHEMAEDSNRSFGSSGDARGGGPSCAAGAGCVMQKCVWGFCSVGVSVSVSGPSVSFSTNGRVDWAQGNHSFNHECAPADLSPTPPGSPGGPHPPPQILDPAPEPGSSGGFYYRVPNGDGVTYSCCWKAGPESPCEWMPC